VTIILYVEGDTEEHLPQFFKRWLDPRTQQKIAIKAVNLRGVSNYLGEVGRRARLALGEAKITGAVGLIDFFRSTLPYPDGTLGEKYAWAQTKLQADVGHPRFRQHFAVHETEAWLLSDPKIFPAGVIEGALNTSSPEAINSQSPPGRRVKARYLSKLKRNYQKRTDALPVFEIVARRPSVPRATRTIGPVSLETGPVRGMGRPALHEPYCTAIVGPPPVLAPSIATITCSAFPLTPTGTWRFT
jgi:hypothetical protein